MLLNIFIQRKSKTTTKNNKQLCEEIIEEAHTYTLKRKNWFL